MLLPFISEGELCVGDISGLPEQYYISENLPKWTAKIILESKKALWNLASAKSTAQLIL